jgi:hypothetical protein
MSTNRSVGRATATQGNVRSAVKPKKDRSTNLCAFTFADGRQCRTPRCSGHLHLCYFHAQKEAERLAAKQVGASQPDQPAVSALQTNLRSESPQPQPTQTPVNCRSSLATHH